MIFRVVSEEKQTSRGEKKFIGVQIQWPLLSGQGGFEGGVGLQSLRMQLSKM